MITDSSDGRKAPGGAWWVREEGNVGTVNTNGIYKEKSSRCRSHCTAGVLREGRPEGWSSILVNLFQERWGVCKYWVRGEVIQVSSHPLWVPLCARGQDVRLWPAPRDVLFQALKWCSYVSLWNMPCYSTLFPKFTYSGAYAAAKSRQSCPTLCDPIEGSLPGSCPWDSPGKNIGVGCHFLLQCMKVKSESEVTQSCLTLSNPMDCTLPGSSVHVISQARVLEWGTIAFSEWCL